MPHPDIERAVEAIEEGRIEEGRFLLETLVPDFLEQQDRTDWACALARTLVMGYEPDTEGALDVLQSVLKDEPREPRLFLAKAIVLSEAGRYEEAERSFAAAVRLDTDDWEIHLNRGIFREQIGKFSQALRSFKVAASRAGPESGEPLARLAWLHRRLGQTREAAEVFREYLKVEPHDSHEWVSLATLESDLGNYKEAQEAYERALRFEPGNVTALFNALITYDRQGESAGMSRCLAELQRWAPQDRRTTWAEGILAAHDGQERLAIERFVSAFREALRDEELGNGELGALASWMFPALAKISGDDEARRLMREAFQAFLFEEGLLEAFVGSFGEERSGARRFVLTIDAADPDTMPDENGIPRQWRYLRRYEVVASDVHEAWSLALETEEVIGGEDLRKGGLIHEDPIEQPARVGIVYMTEGNAYLED